MKLSNKAGYAAKAAAVVAVIATVATAGFDIKETKATLTAPNGKCGFSLSHNFSGLSTSMNGQDKAISSIGVIDFDTLTLNAVHTRVSNFGKADAVSNSSTGSSKFTIAAASTQGQYTLSLNDAYETKILLSSTNSGNTYLMQTLANENRTGTQATGVCQSL